MTSAFTSRTLSRGAFRKSPSGKIDEGPDVRGVLEVVMVGAPWGGVIVNSTGGAIVVLLPSLNCLPDAFDPFFDAG